MLRLPDVPRRADIAVFGGSGFYSFLADTETVPTETPYGPPSADPVVGLIDGRRVAFLPRHGHDHSVPAHRVNHRANVWAMAALGAQVLVSPFACGSLRRELVPGDFVVVDQLVDRGHGRDGTFFDGPETFHLPFADPYDDDLRRQMIDHARRLGYVVHDGGTVVVIPGPRFSTRAESRWHAAMGWDVVNMTQAPEIPLANEAGLRAVGLGLVTDFDAGLEDDPSVPAVTQAEVFGFLESNAQRVQDLLRAALPALDLG
ncbi:MAG TPA: MTAP family purine nucleoside phosphorylase [Microthrixaceae bacterium]|nr:MTAP family purine nucleoside phosphorylase [Microthrixaceae bacterium]